jgi:DNA repair photolyase
VSFSVSTLDTAITDTLEPGAPTPLERLETMRRCKDAGLTVGVNCIPLLPFISDSDEKVERMVEAAKDHGADYIFIGGLTLFGSDPASSKMLYYKFLERKYPELRSEYEKLYRGYYGPSGKYLAALNRRAELICGKYKIRRSILGLG